MKINWLSIKDFRGFRDCEITFPKNSNIVVFIGINGAGKSAVLDAIKIILDILVKDICSQKRTSEDKIFDENNININADTYRLNIGFWDNLKDSNNNSDNFFNLLLSSAGLNKVISGTYKGFSRNLRSSIAKIELFNLPIFIFYSVTRNIIYDINSDNGKNDVSNNISDYKYPQYFAYENSLNSHVNSFNEFIHWFRQEEDFENQLQIRAQTFGVYNEKLQVVRIAIDEFLNKFGFARFSKLRIERIPIGGNNSHPYRPQYFIKLVIDKDEQRFEFSQLSSGEKMMLSLVVDIARRLAIANPSLENKLEGEGIVLVDEIDLHLHPQWQRKLLPALTHTFPNIQFIVTTHSPQVLSHIPRESVFLLEDNKISDREIYTEGRDSNSILQDAFHVPKYEKEYEKKT
jgi:predicted ATP-binding protein involved in virulence